jgi:hypothetical protein
MKKRRPCFPPKKMKDRVCPKNEDKDSVDHHHVVLLPRAATESVSSLPVFSYSSLDGTSVGGMVSHAHTILGYRLINSVITRSIGWHAAFCERKWATINTVS